MPSSTWESWSYSRQVRVRGLDKGEIPLRGQADLQVAFGNQTKKLEVLFMRMGYINQLGRQWIHQLGLDLHRLFVGSIVLGKESLHGLLGIYSMLFHLDPGRCTKLKAHLHMQEGA